MIHHHPPFEMLFDFASGSLTEPAALVVAAHAEMCAECRREIARFEAVGGEMLEQIDPVTMSANALDAVLARLDEPEPMLAPAARAAMRENRSARKAVADTAASARPIADLIPSALLAYLGDDLTRLAWRKVGGMFEEIRLPISVKGFKASLMRLKPGAMMPTHTHRGREYTLVLAGGYRDNGSQYGPGDFSLKDASDVHRPVVDSDEECICLAVLDAPVKLTSMMGRLVNPFLRM
jgi:putative transcriptional regulator